MPIYTHQQILEQLDVCANDYTFPMLDNGYVYPIDSRLSAYRNDNNWVLLIEVVGFSCRGRGHKGINNGLHIFGNCLDFEPGTNNANFIRFTDDSDEGPSFDKEYQERLNPDVNTMLLRGKKVSLPKDPEFYEVQGMELDAPPKVMIWEFLRGIRAQHKESFFATEEEIRERIPKDLPLILKLNNWYHNNLAADELPSDIETFEMIAKVLETGNTELYKPTIKPNSQWWYWPNGGML